MMVTSGRSAGTSNSGVPSSGDGTWRRFGLWPGISLPNVVRVGMYGEPRLAASNARPRSCNPFDASRPHQLVEENIRNRSDQGQVAPLLADDFMAGRKGNQRL